MGSILIKSKCGTRIKVVVNRQKKCETGEYEHHFEPHMLTNGDELELKYYDYKNPNKVIIQTMD